MLKRMNKIYTILVMEKLEQDKTTHCPEFGSEMLAGWYDNYDDAFISVSGNSCDINEFCYQYALIEEVGEGLYNPAINRWWFEFNPETGKYIEIKEPDFCRGFASFTIG